MPAEIFPKRPAIAQRQIDLLRALLNAVQPANAFYAARLEAARAPGKVVRLGDFHGHFPFTTKQELSDDQAAYPPYGTNLTFPIDRYTRCHQTSGTSGRPLRWLDTPESWDWLLRDWETVLRAAGVTRADTAFFAFSFGPFLGFWAAFEAAARLGCRCLPGGGMKTAARVRAIMELGATVLCCTPTYAIHLAEAAAAEGIDLSASPVKILVVAGEAGGSIPATRTRLESLWPGARVFDHHGMTETGPVSYQCPARPGVLHVMEGSFIAEIIDPATGAHAAHGEAGELVLTPLGRIGSPLLRYRTGDLVKPSPDTACECGRHELALEGGILGRVDDMVVVRGVNVYPSAVEDLIRSVGGVAEYQVKVSSARALAELSITVEPEPRIADPAALGRQLEHAIQTALNLRVSVTTAPPGTLPRFEMKAKRWVREG